jgi:TolA-binding protein
MCSMIERTVLIARYHYQMSKPAKTVRFSPSLAALLVLPLLISSCSFWRDTTTYFNVYYDAQRHIDKYESGLIQSQSTESGAIAAVTTHRWLDEEYESRRALRLRGAVPPPVKLFYKSSELASRSGDVKHLDSAIILGSKILADKNPTKYVEGALFLTGKALYYKNDYSRARRKFNELLYKYPKTEFSAEVGRLLTQTLIATRQFDTATKVVLATIQRLEASGNKDDMPEARKMYAEVILLSGAENIAIAADQLELAEANLSEEDASRIAYERGNLRYIEGNWQEAEKAFTKAIAQSPDNFTVSESMISRALALRRLGRFNEAKKELEIVLSKVRYSASHPVANYELAVTVEEEGRAKAKSRFRDANFSQNIFPNIKQAYFVLDTTYRNVSQAIMVRSRFRQAELYRQMGELDTAARFANIIIGTKDFSSPEINDFVNERMRALQRFAQQKNILERTEKLERLIERARTSGSNILATMQREIRILAERQILGARWRPDGPNTITVEEETLIADAEARIKRERESAGEPVSMLRIVDTNRFVDSIRFIAAKAHYELGRSYDIFSEQMSASLEYREALDKKYFSMDTAKSNFNARTIFSWIELEHQRKNYQTRDSLVALLTSKYGESMYASAASRLYTRTDSAFSTGDLAFAGVMANMRTYGFEVQKPKLLEISNIYNHEDVAPRALYTIGIYFEEGTRYDSAVYYYNRVVKEYPFSKYAEEVRPRLNLASNTTKVQTIPPNINTNPDTSTDPNADQNIPVQMDQVDPNIINVQNDENGLKQVPVNIQSGGGIGLTPPGDVPPKTDKKK